MNEAMQFVKGLFEPGDVLCVTTIHSTRCYRGTKNAVTNNSFVTLEDAISESTLAQMAKLNEQGWNIFCSMQPFVSTDVSTRRKPRFVSMIRHVFLDLDENGVTSLAKLCEAVASGLIPAPAFVVESSPHKFHCQWNIDGISIDECRALNVALIGMFNGDKACKDVARVLRVPGFKNMKSKYGPNFPTARIIEHDDGTIYTLAAFRIPINVVVEKEHPTAESADIQKSLDRLVDAMDTLEIDYEEGVEWDGSGWKFDLDECPWADSHSNGNRGDASVFIQPSSRYMFHCLHDHCADKTWADFRTYLDARAKSEGKKSPKFSGGVQLGKTLVDANHQ